VEVELCAAIDGSGSISATDFDFEKQGLANAIQDPAVTPHDGTVAVAVVQFSSTAQTEVSLTTIDSQATADGIASGINSIGQLGGSTAIGDAITLCSQTLTRVQSVKSVIDVSTDGNSNTGENPVDAANGAIQAGVDAINALGVGSSIVISDLKEFVRPAPGYEAPPYAGDGFYVLVDTFDEYLAAIKEKIRAEIQPPSSVPTMGGLGLGLLAMLLAAFGFRRLQLQGREK
jgi:hypothetical protein